MDGWDCLCSGCECLDSGEDGEKIDIWAKSASLMSKVSSNVVTTEIVDVVFVVVVVLVCDMMGYGCVVVVGDVGVCVVVC